MRVQGRESDCSALGQRHVHARKVDRYTASNQTVCQRRGFDCLQVERAAAATAEARAVGSGMAGASAEGSCTSYFVPDDLHRICSCPAQRRWASSSLITRHSSVISHQSSRAADATSCSRDASRFGALAPARSSSPTTPHLWRAVPR